MYTTLIRRLAVTGLAAGLTTAAALVAATPAQAVPGLQQITVTSANNSQSVKSGTATCPAGTVVLDGGAFIFGNAGGQVRLSGLRQVVTIFGTGFQATATEDSTGFGGNWRLSTYAVCAPMPAGWQQVWTTSATNSQSWRSSVVTCPTGKKVIGAGAVVNNGYTGVELHTIYPTPDLDAVIAQAYEVEGGHGSSWSLTAYAICANPLPGLVRVVGDALAPEVPAGATCPGITRLHGLGGLINAAPGEVFLTAMYPAANLTSTTTIGAEDQNGTPVAWAPVAYAICAN
jgi:hypothetical protein